MSDGTHGHGTTLAGATAGTIGNVMSIGNTQTRESIDISSMDSTNKDREFIAGMKDAGSLSIEINLDNSAAGVQNSLQTAYDLGSAEAWTITFPDTATFVASGFITDLGFSDPFEDKMTATLEIKLSGGATFTDVP